MSRERAPTNLAQLQDCIKREPHLYREEFEQQYRHYKTLLEMVQFDSSSYNKEFIDLIMFLAHCSSRFRDELETFPRDLFELLRLFSTTLHPEIRMAVVKALILLKNKSLIISSELMNFLFDLLICPDKKLRVFIRQYIYNDIKSMNKKARDEVVNGILKYHLYSMMKDSNFIAARTALSVMIELYQKNFWKDSKTANFIAKACYSNITKIMMMAVKFFIGKDESDQEEKDDTESSSDDDNMPSEHEIIMSNKVNKKTRKRKRLLARSKAAVKRLKRKAKKESFDFSAIYFLNDAQNLAEYLFKKLETFNERFEFKVLLINFISRLIAIHELILLNFYPYLQRFLHPRQPEVTKFLQYFAQASHKMVPPDVIEPILKVIANNFVTERNSNEVMAVGINSIREICSRCPLAMNEDLLQDLTEYASYKDKNVSMAAKSLIQLYRVVNPNMLKKKDRGRPTEATKEFQPSKYGEVKAMDFIEGAEVLDKDVPTEKQDDSNGSWTEVSEDSIDALDTNEEDVSEEDSDWDEESESDIESDLEVYYHYYQLNPKERAKFLSANRIFTQEDFKKIRLAQLKKQVNAAKPKRLNSSLKADQNKPGPSRDTKELVPLSSIIRMFKKAKADKLARIQSIEAGRENRGKYGGRKEKKNQFASKNKNQMKKRKTFMMVKHKINNKRKKSFKDKQIALRKSLLKRC